MPRTASATTVLLAAAASVLGACAGTARPGAVAHAPLPDPLALSCLTCHAGPDPDRHAIDLSTRTPAEIARLLRAYRDDAREGTVMPRLVRGLGDDDIARLALALGAPPTPPERAR